MYAPKLTITINKECCLDLIIFRHNIYKTLYNNITITQYV